MREPVGGPAVSTEPASDEPDETIAVVEAVYQTLRRSIVECELAPNTVLSQVQLAKRFGVSRTPLREVLRMLERERLVESRHNRRIRISGFSLEDLEEVYATRIVMESLAARSRMRTMTLAAIADLEVAIKTMGQSSEIGDYPVWQRAHRTFHQVLTGDGESRTAEAISQLADHADRYRRIHASTATLSWGAGVREHEQILEHVRRFDPDAVSRSVARHVGRAALTTLHAAYPDYRSGRIEDAMMLVLGHAEVRPGTAAPH